MTQEWLEAVADQIVEHCQNHSSGSLQLVVSLQNVDAAIAAIESSRATHLDWAQWFEAHPDEEAKHSRTIHGAAEQRKIVAEYDNVLMCLRAFRAMQANSD